MLDILIVAGIGFTQLVITWYGIQVSVGEHRVRNAFIIGIIGAIGIGLTVWGAIRSGTVQANLQAQLEHIQHNTEQPPTVNVSVPQPPVQEKHTQLQFTELHTVDSYPLLPYHKDEKPALNMGYVNSGDFAITDSHMFAKVVVANTEDQDKLLKKYRAALKPIGLAGTLNPHVGRGIFSTFFGSALTDEDVSQLKSGKKRLCGIAFIDWKDSSGRYETDFNECFATEPTGELSLHSGAQNSVEHKLK